MSTLNALNRMIEKGGTGIEKGGTGIEKGGTGIRALRYAGMMLAGLLLSASAFAAPGGTWQDWGKLGGTLQFGVQNKSTLTVSWSTIGPQGNPILLIGAGQLGKGGINMGLYKVVTGFQTPGKPMPMMVPWGQLTLAFDGCGNAHGAVQVLKSEAGGTGTGKSEAGGTGTGKSEAGGTGTGKSEAGGTGTGKSEAGGTGTGKSEAGGTGRKYTSLGEVILIGPKAGSC